MQRYIPLSTEPPKDENDWQILEKTIELALRENISKAQQKTGTNEGRKESIYLGDSGTALMEITIAGHRKSLVSPQGDLGTIRDQSPDILSPALLISLADHHLASAFHDGAFCDTEDVNGRPNVRDGAHISFLETPVGIATLILSRYPLGRQTLFGRTNWARCLDYLKRVLDVLLKDDSDFPDDDDGCEVLYGRAGFLYALLYLRSTLEASEALKSREAYSGDSRGGEIQPERLKDLESVKRSLISDEILSKVVESIIRRGRIGARTYRFDFEGVQPDLMWTWHSKRYLGGAHGIAGILQMLLRCPTSIVGEYFPEIIQTIDWLVNCQDSQGNWPTRAPDLNQTTTGDHDLIQWCHGASGMIILLSTILRMSLTPGTAAKLTDKQQIRFVVSLQRACALVYMRGLLRKGVGLCHGVAGSVYALLAASDLLDGSETSGQASRSSPQNSLPTSSSTAPSASPPISDHHRPYFTQACHLALLATSVSFLTNRGEMKIPDHPWSLYEGMAGMCCAWDEILLRFKKKEVPQCSGMPGYDDIFIGD